MNMILVRYCLTLLCLLKVSFSFDSFVGSDSTIDVQYNNFDKFTKPNYIKREFVDSDDSDDDNTRTGSIIDSDNIAEWNPIITNISAGQQDYYSFSIDTADSALGFSASYEILIFLSGNICNLPNVTDDVSLVITYAFNDTIADNPGNGVQVSFENGYAESFAVSPINTTNTTTGSNTTSRYSDLYVTIELYNSTTNVPLKAGQFPDEVWNYRLSISENDLVFQWDQRTWLEILDTDDTSALLVTGQSASSSSGNNATLYDPSLYDIYIYTYEESELFDGRLNQSLCAIKNGQYLVSSVNSSSINSSSSNGVNLDETKLTIQKITQDGNDSVNEYFYVTGLNSSTTYVAYLTKKVGKNGSLSSVGGILFANVPFTTEYDNTCSLIHTLDFCKDVAYSVPTSSLALNNKTLMAETYENISRSLYANFSRALQLIPCDTDKDARYSPVRGCDDCAEAYRNWICSVSIPRCTTQKSEFFIPRDKNENRNTYIDELIDPIRDYYEVLPCIDMCYAMVRDCPSQFGFSCPDSKQTPGLLFSSYSFFLEGSEYVTCNLMGNIVDTVIYSP